MCFPNNRPRITNDVNCVCHRNDGSMKMDTCRHLLFVSTTKSDKKRRKQLGKV